MDPRAVSLSISKIFNWGLFGVGAFVCAMNFYLSFLRYRLYCVRGRKGEYRDVSGAPLVGSFIFAVLLIRPGILFGPEAFLFQLPIWARIAAFALAVLDAGGPHWFIGMMVWLARKKPAASRHQR